MQDLIFFGIQGSGKGTQAERVAAYFDLNIFEMGAELRSIAQEESDLGKKVSAIMSAGELVSDDVVMDIVERFLGNISADTHVLFDGIPRTMIQAQMLGTLLHTHKRSEVGIYIELPEEVALERLLLRKRADDTEEGIKKRFENYYSATLPVINHYREENRLITINGNQGIDEVTAEILNAVKNYE